MAAQVLLPIGKLPDGGIAHGPPALPAREIGKLKRRFGQLRISAGRKGGIELRELLKEDADRPAVHDDVMENHDQNMVVGTEAQQPRTEQWCALKVERAPRLLLRAQL